MTIIKSILLFGFAVSTVIHLASCASDAEDTTTSVNAEAPRPTSDRPTELDIDYITGQFDPTTHPSFTLIDSIYADRSGMYMRADAYVQFIRMYDAAKSDDVNLQIRSAARNFEYQKGIWERKWNGETKIENGKDASKAYPNPKDRALAILRFSSMPGTSRHHWGTDIDLNSFENSWFEQGEGLAIYNWLQANAASYGFCQPYTAKGDDRPNGYEEERWHWSFMPVSKSLTSLAQNQLQDSMIAGFAGAETATEIAVVDNYVLGISSSCRSQK